LKKEGRKAFCTTAFLPPETNLKTENGYPPIWQVPCRDHKKLKINACTGIAAFQHVR
jgi:hypothetical protein